MKAPIKNVGSSITCYASKTVTINMECIHYVEQSLSLMARLAEESPCMPSKKITCKHLNWLMATYTFGEGGMDREL